MTPHVAEGAQPIEDCRLVSRCEHVALVVTSVAEHTVEDWEYTMSVNILASLRRAHIATTSSNLMETIIDWCTKGRWQWYSR